MWTMLNSLLAKVFKSKYYCDQNILEATIALHQSWAWKGLDQFLPTFKLGLSKPFKNSPIRKPHPQGLFITKSIYHSFINIQYSPQLPSLMRHRLWKLSCSPKVKSFIWFLCHGSLPTADILHQRHIIPTNLCSICQQPDYNCNILILSPIVMHFKIFGMLLVFT